MSDQSVIDQSAIERLKEWGGAELPRKMIDIFLSNSPERMEQIRDGISTETPRKAETGAHSLKSSAGNVGAIRLQSLAEEAESLAEKEDLSALGDIWPRLEEAFGDACEELKNLLEGMEE